MLNFITGQLTAVLFSSYLATLNLKLHEGRKSWNVTKQRKRAEREREKAAKRQTRQEKRAEKLKLNKLKLVMVTDVIAYNV